MPVVAIAVGFLGTAAGTAIGAAIGGSILGVSMATIGGVIGAGLAGGALAYATGGSFGQGFLMGAGGAVLGGFLKAGLGDTIGGATQVADGTTTAEMLAAQGGAEFAPEALSGMGDLGATGATTGLGELGGVGAETGAETFGIGDVDIPQGTPIDSGAYTAPLEQTLSETANAQSFGDTQGLASSAGFNATPSTGVDQFAATPSTLSDSSPVSSAYSSAAETGSSTTPVGGGLENIGQSTPTTSATSGVEGVTPQTTTAAAPSQGLGGTIRNMANTSDEWLRNTFGRNAPTTGKLLMGGGQYLMDRYNTNKQERQAQGLAPMSFEEYQQQFSNTDDYRNASRQMAQSGRTGTLPVLLARLKERARTGYAGYLPKAKAAYYDTQAGVQANRNASLSRLFSGLGYGS